MVLNRICGVSTSHFADFKEVKLFTFCANIWNIPSTGNIFGAYENSYNLLQVLNISQSYPAQATLASSITTPSKVFKSDYNFTILNLFVAQPDPNDHLGSRTKVCVEVIVDFAKNNSAVISSAHGDVLKYVRDYLYHWKNAALSVWLPAYLWCYRLISCLQAIAEDGILESRSNLTANEQDLLHLLGFNDELNSPSIYPRFASDHGSSASSLDDYMLKLKHNSRAISTLNQGIIKAPSRFQESLVSSGITRRKRYSILSIFRIKRLFRLFVWSGVFKLTIEISKRWDDLGSIFQFVKKNALRFFERRISTPTKR